MQGPQKGRWSALGWPGCGSRTSLPGPCARLAPLKCTVKSTAQFLLEAPGGHLVRLVTAGNRTWVESRPGGGRGRPRRGRRPTRIFCIKGAAGRTIPPSPPHPRRRARSRLGILVFRAPPPPPPRDSCSPRPGGPGGGPGQPLRVQRGTRAGALPAAPARSPGGVRQRINGECRGRGGPAAGAL